MPDVFKEFKENTEILEKVRECVAARSEATKHCEFHADSLRSSLALCRC